MGGEDDGQGAGRARALGRDDKTNRPTARNGHPQPPFASPRPPSSAMSVPTLLRSLFPLPRTTSWSQWATVYLAQGLIAGCIDGAINYFIGARRRPSRPCRTAVPR